MSCVCDAWPSHSEVPPDQEDMLLHTYLPSAPFRSAPSFISWDSAVTPKPDGELLHYLMCNWLTGDAFVESIAPVFCLLNVQTNTSSRKNQFERRVELWDQTETIWLSSSSINSHFLSSILVRSATSHSIDSVVLFWEIILNSDWFYALGAITKKYGIQ